jgi:hypothetical protein
MSGEKLARAEDLKVLEETDLSPVLRPQLLKEALIREITTGTTKGSKLLRPCRVHLVIEVVGLISNVEMNRLVLPI